MNRLLFFTLFISATVTLNGCASLRNELTPNSMKPIGILGEWKTDTTNPYPSLRISQNQLSIINSKTGKVRSQVPVQWSTTVELPPSNSRCQRTNVKITPVDANTLTTRWSCKSANIPPKVITLHRASTTPAKR